MGSGVGTGSGTGTGTGAGAGEVTAKGWLGVAAAVIVAVAIVVFVTLSHGVSGTPSQRLSSWTSSTTLGQDIGTLEGDGASAARAARAGNAKALSTVCAAMANAAQTYNDDLPSPDAAITQWLARAYSLEYDAAEGCYHAGVDGKVLLAQSARDRAQAATLFDKVLHKIRRVTLHSVPTTTTTVPYEGTTTAVL